MKIFSTSFISNLLFLLFLLPNNATAQRTCEDPLSLEWLQFYLGDPCTDSVYAFEYDGNDYVYATVNQSCIAADASNTLYNCNDQSFCQVFGFTPPEDQCDAGLVAAIEPFLTNENLIYPLLPVRGCENPLSLNWVQEAIELPCTDGIYAFEHEGVPYIYRSTACEYLDDPNRLYNCIDKSFCFVRGFTLPQDQCDTSNLSLSKYLVGENLIWSSPLLKLLPEYNWLKTVVNLKNCQNTTIKEFVTSNNTKYVSVQQAAKHELYGANGSVLCTTLPNFNCESIYGLTTSNSEWSCNLKPLICGLDEPQNSLPWLQQLIDDTNCDCNTSIIQYCYKDAVYFDSTPLSPGYCADYPGFIYDEFGTVICQNGGITGGDCFRLIPDFYSVAELIGTAWSCNDKCGCQNFNSPVCGEDGNIYESNCAATCAGVTEVPCDDNGGGCETLAFSNLNSGCDCCSDIIVFEITGGDGNYEVTTLDGTAIKNGMLTGSLPIGANELIVTDGQGCQATGIFNNYPFCCEVPPVCYGLDVTYDCDNGLQMGGMADCNSIAITDENGSIYYEGDFLQNGNYTFIEANQGQVSPPCVENVVTVLCAAGASNCALPPDVGPCDAYLPRYYYNPEAGECMQFVYGGCDGNANNYETYDICSESCGYTYQCTIIENPLELPWLAEIIRNANGCFVNEVAQFTYNENIYFKTNPGWTGGFCPTDLPVSYYNCEGLNICSQGFTPYPTCNQAMVLASNQTGNVIWAYTDDSCEYEFTGTVKDYSGLAGCSFVIELNNETVLEPIEVPPGFSFYDGQTVELSYKEEPQASICQVGVTAKIICIQEVESNCNNLQFVNLNSTCSSCCEDLLTFEIVGGDGNYTVTTIDGTPVYNNMPIYEIGAGSVIALVVTDGQGCISQQSFMHYPFCCEVPPACGLSEVSYDCVYGLQFTGQGECNSIVQLRDEAGNIYSYQSMLPNGSYTLTTATEGNIVSPPCSTYNLEVNCNDIADYCEIDAVEITSSPDLCGFGIVSLQTNDVFGNEGPDDGEIAFIKVNEDDSFEVLEENAVHDASTCYYAIAYRSSCDVPDFLVSSFEEVLNFEGNYRVSSCFEINLIQAPEYNISTEPYCNGEALFTVGVTVNGGSGEYIIGVDYTGEQVYGTNGETLITFAGGQQFYDIYPTDAVTGCSNDYIIPLEDPGCSNEANCDNPLELEFVQNAIDDETCTGGIYAFDFDGQSYIYIKTLCEFIDAGNTLYNCNTKENCTIGGESIFVEECYNLYDRLNNLINEENLIWTKPCEYEYAGTVRSYDCGLVIESPDDNILEPEIIPGGFTLEDGQKVEYSYRRIPIGATCEFAEKAEIICIRLADEGCACDDDYTPVCGVDGNTYSNACHAECEGVEIAYEGECEEPCICTKEYYPVCGVDGNTYGNPCMAECEGVEIAYEGECEDGCGCTREYSPVCGVDGNTYSNACQAGCEGVEVAYEGECEEPCICTDEYAPVCGADGNTYGNACQAGCEGVEVAYEGECEEACICTAEYDPVCGADGNTYSNACVAECENIAIAYAGECGLTNNAAMFDKYNWLNNMISPEVCTSGTKISEYLLGTYNFIYIEWPGGESSLYLQDGTYYCSDAPGYSCLALYGFSEPTDSYSCLSDNANDNIVVTANQVNCNPDGTFSVEISATGALSGTYGLYHSYGNGAPDFINFGEGETIIFEGNAANAENEMFTAYIYDEYLADAAAKAFKINVMNCLLQSNTGLYTNYSWLSSVINENDCLLGSSVTEYNFGHYSFVYVKNQNTGSLYYQDGTFYCSDAQGYSCLSIYGFNNPTAVWNCDKVVECDASSNPVCGTDGNTYNNECDALYAGTAVANYQACTQPTMFENYDWLNEIVTPANCGGNTTVSEFDFGYYSFIYVDSDNVGTLYFGDGTYYCTDAPGYSCLSLYGFTAPTKQWNCDGQLIQNKNENSLNNYLEFTADFKLYPNPSYGQFNVETLNPAKTQTMVNVMDMQGKILKTIQLSDNEHIASFDLSNMTKGIYMVHLQTDSSAKTQKLIIR